MQKLFLFIIPVVALLAGRAAFFQSQPQPTPSPIPSSPASAVAVSPSPGPASSPAPSATSTHSRFPMASCGDQPTKQKEFWHPVLIEGDLEKIRNQYCADAVSPVGQGADTKIVQVASFTSRAQALEFARAINGTVGVPYRLDAVKAQAKPPVPKANTTSSEAPKAMNPASSRGDEIQVQQSGILTSHDRDSPINIRAYASTQSYVRHIAYAGDAVEVQRKKLGTDGYDWYYVSLRPRVQGWIRSSYVVLNPSSLEVKSSSDYRSSSTSDSLASSSSTSDTTDRSIRYPGSPDSSSASEIGSCDYPWQVDSAGRQCGKRAASERPGGRLGGEERKR